MAVLVSSKPKKRSVLKDEFEQYLDKLRIYTTFNGIKVSSFSSYKRYLGLK